MIGNVVSRRYASALFDLGREAGMSEMERYGATLSALGDAMERSPALSALFRNPVLSPGEKKSVILALLKKAGGGEMERRFCEMLADKGRLPLLGAIAADYGDMLYKAKGISRGVLTTAVVLDEARQKEITKRLEKQTGRELELVFAVDEHILGGLTLKIGDMVLDASLRAQLDNLRESIRKGE